MEKETALFFWICGILSIYLAMGFFTIVIQKQLKFFSGKLDKIIELLSERVERPYI